MTTRCRSLLVDCCLLARAWPGLTAARGGQGAAGLEIRRLLAVIDRRTRGQAHRPDGLERRRARTANYAQTSGGWSDLTSRPMDPRLTSISVTKGLAPPRSEYDGEGQTLAGMSDDKVARCKAATASDREQG